MESGPLCVRRHPTARLPIRPVPLSPLPRADLQTLVARPRHRHGLAERRRSLHRRLPAHRRRTRVPVAELRARLPARTSRTTAPLSPAARCDDTQLPAGSNPRTLALATATAPSRRLRRRVRAEPCSRSCARADSPTRSPRPLSAPTRSTTSCSTPARGFCGHYASAFVDMMRAGGVPARVVTGYLGGQLNPYDGTLTVRQSDAHAWAEVWLRRPRLDTRRSHRSRRPREALPRHPRPPAARRLRPRAPPTQPGPWLNTALERWDAAERLVERRAWSASTTARNSTCWAPSASTPPSSATPAGYSPPPCWPGCAWISWQVGRKPPAPRHPTASARAYARLCRKLARTGLPRAPHHGPLAYAQLIARYRPDLSPQVGPLLEQYAALRFGPTSNSAHPSTSAPSSAPWPASPELPSPPTRRGSD